MRIALLILAAVMLCVQTALADDAPRRKVLILYSWHDQMPWQAGIRRGLEQYLDELPENRRPELFEERIDVTRTRYSDSDRALGAYLQTKYAHVQFDAVIAESENATRFLAHRPELFPGVPLSIINAGAVAADASSDLQFKVTEDWPAAVGAVLHTLPDLDRLVVTLDPGDYGGNQRGLIQRAAATLPAGVAFELWDDFSLPELYERASRLPEGSAILTTPIFGDRSGGAPTPREVVRRLSAAAAVPVFVHFDTLLGTGAVGGFVISAERTGALIGRIAAGRQSVQDSAELDASVKAYVFDFEALARWRIAEQALPRPYQLINQPDSVWIRYRWQIAITLGVLVLQGVLILALIQALRRGREVRRLLALERDSLEARVAERTRDLVASSRQLEAQNEELDAYAHTVAHDLKNPLTVMIGMSQVLANVGAQLSPERLGENLAALGRNARKLVEIVDALLLLGSVRKQPQIALEPLDMAQIIAEVRDRLADFARERGAAIEVAGDWPKAAGFRPWVEQVWTNYLSNALKYGGSPPRVSLRAEVDGAGLVQMLCVDHGSGIADADRERVFAPFTRLEGAAAEGHGVGLSTVKRAVERMGGAVGVRPTPGGGSTFWFTLPAV